MTLDETIQQHMPFIHELLTRRKETVAASESCTAGLVSYALTTIAGSSEYVKFGWVVYSEKAKHQEMLLPMDVPIYSQKCAGHLAVGAKARSGSTYGIGITGLATPEKGEVWYAIAYPGQSGLGDIANYRQSYLTNNRYMRDRQTIRHAIVDDVLPAWPWSNGCSMQRR